MSHGPVDIFAAKRGRVLLIQVKSGSSRVNRQELEMLKSFAVAFNADAQVWFFRKKAKVKKVTVSKKASDKFNPPDTRSMSQPLEKMSLTVVKQMNLTS